MAAAAVRRQTIFGLWPHSWSRPIVRIHSRLRCHFGVVRNRANRSAKAREGSRRTAFCPRRATKGREEHLFVHEGPLRAAKNTSVRGGRGGTQRTLLFDRRNHEKGREEGQIAGHTQRRQQTEHPQGVPLRLGWLVEMSTGPSHWRGRERSRSLVRVRLQYSNRVRVKCAYSARCESR